MEAPSTELSRFSCWIVRIDQPSSLAESPCSPSAPLSPRCLPGIADFFLFPLGPSRNAQSCRLLPSFLSFRSSAQTDAEGKSSGWQSALVFPVPGRYAPYDRRCLSSQDGTGPVKPLSLTGLMTTTLSPGFWRRFCCGKALLLPLLVLVARAPATSADELFPPKADFNRALLLPPGLKLELPPLLATPIDRSARIRLFRIIPGFLNDPVGLDLEDNPLTDPKGINSPWPSWWNSPSSRSEGDGSMDRMTIALGNDNPFFELRRAGDPGGVGYYRVATQLQLLDSRRTACSLGLQAYVPAGIDSWGVQEGPQVLCPAISVYHDLGDGTAIQGFVSKNVQFDNPRQIGGSQLRQRIEYGVAVQRPLMPPGPNRTSNVFMFVETLGRYRYTPLTGAPLSVWEVLPGMQWRLSETLWLSGGVVIPVSATAIDPGYWQFTCSFQF